MVATFFIRRLIMKIIKGLMLCIFSTACVSAADEEPKRASSGFVQCVRGIAGALIPNPLVRAGLEVLAEASADTFLQTEEQNRQACSAIGRDMLEDMQRVEREGSRLGWSPLTRSLVTDAVIKNGIDRAGFTRLKSLAPSTDSLIYRLFHVTDHETHGASNYLASGIIWVAMNAVIRTNPYFREAFLREGSKGEVSFRGAYEKRLKEKGITDDWAKEYFDNSFKELSETQRTNILTNTKKGVWWELAKSDLSSVSADRQSAFIRSVIEKDAFSTTSTIEREAKTILENIECSKPFQVTSGPNGSSVDYNLGNGASVGAGVSLVGGALVFFLKLFEINR